jgi:uncharacterized cupredoxin-like copper-binding protein
MQNTTTHAKPTNSLSGLGLFVIGAAATILFLLTISRFGLLDFGSSQAAVPPSDLTLTAEKFQFGESEIRVKVGQPVTINLTNADILPHSFDVDKLDVHIPMPGNELVTATFTPATPGTYTFYCGIPGHVEAGMVGKLVVEP